MKKNEIEQRRSKLYGLLGELPPRRLPISVTEIGREVMSDYCIERLVLNLNGIEGVPAFYLSPASPDKKKPVVVFNHSHGGMYAMGKNELLSPAPYMYHMPYAQELTRLGYSVLAIDHWAFGERRGRSESATFKDMLWNGQVMWGMMVYDSLRAVDYLCTRSDVDPERIATLGMSMGSTMAWWLAALDTRIKVCVDICCLTDFEALRAANGHDGHGIYYYVPNLLQHFTTAQINALIAPRAHLALAGIYDSLTPVSGLDVIDQELRKAYKEHASAWKLRRYRVAHLETMQMRSDALSFLKEWL